MRVCLEFDFEVAGELSVGPDEKLHFPALPTMPGLYRFRLLGQSNSVSTYIGETNNLRRRAYHYRNPGPSQQTNNRMNSRLSSHLGKGGAVEFAVLTSATVTIGEEKVPVDFNHQAYRRLFENAALAANPKGELIENLP